jgi:hypothetical protein
MECMKYLREFRRAVNMEIFDTWMREYQVKPSYYSLQQDVFGNFPKKKVIVERTHPMVTMDSCSGYLLTGITVPSGISSF